MLMPSGSETLAKLIFADESLFWDVRRESKSARDGFRGTESMAFPHNNTLHRLSVQCTKQVKSLIRCSLVVV